MCLHSHVNEADVGLTWQHAFDPQDISVKTKEILTNMVALADECEDSKITLEALKRHHFPPVTENFLFHLAAAEQLLCIWCCFQCLCSEMFGRMNSGWALVEFLCCRCGDNCCFLKSSCSPYTNNTPDACAPKDGRAFPFQSVCVCWFCSVLTRHSPTFLFFLRWCPTPQSSKVQCRKLAALHETSDTFSKYICMERITLSPKSKPKRACLEQIEQDLSSFVAHNVNFYSSAWLSRSVLCMEHTRFGGGRRAHVAKPFCIRCIIKVVIAIHVHKTFYNPSNQFSSTVASVWQHISCKRNCFEQ